MLRSRAEGAVLFTKVKGHATKKDVQQGIILQCDRYGNHCADKLATTGAAAHAVADEIVRRARCRRLLATDVQSMMVDIAQSRAERLRHLQTAADAEFVEVPDDDSIVEISSDDD
eukprot:11578961-Karenia_brevis.AAC.1